MKGKRGNQINDINITPLTDIFLVLLIIMMVVSPMLNFRGLDLAVLTVGPSSGDPNKKDAVVLSIGKEGGFSIAGASIAETDLTGRLRQENADGPRSLIIEIDPDATHEAMTRALSAATEAGISQVAIQEPEPASP